MLTPGIRARTASGGPPIDRARSAGVQSRLPPKEIRDEAENLEEALVVLARRRRSAGAAVARDERAGRGREAASHDRARGRAGVPVAEAPRAERHRRRQ